MIHIIDYNAGNLTSVKRALDYLDIPCRITFDTEEIRNAERIIFPGVGHAGSAMKTLIERGLDTALKEAYKKGTPVLGICLGTQIVLSHSEEGDVSCLGLIGGNTRKFSLQDKSLKIPHMGWDGIKVQREHFILKDVNESDEFYFVHSFYPEPNDQKYVFATCEYEVIFPAVIGMKNLFATQFHPEKSGKAGLSVLNNFSKWDGSEC